MLSRPLSWSVVVPPSALTAPLEKCRNLALLDGVVESDELSGSFLFKSACPFSAFGCGIGSSRNVWASNVGTPSAGGGGTASPSAAYTRCWKSFAIFSGSGMTSQGIFSCATRFLSAETSAPSLMRHACWTRNADKALRPTKILVQILGSEGDCWRRVW